MYAIRSYYDEDVALLDDLVFPDVYGLENAAFEVLDDLHPLGGDDLPHAARNFVENRVMGPGQECAEQEADGDRQGIRPAVASAVERGIDLAHEFEVGICIF